MLSWSCELPYSRHDQSFSRLLRPRVKVYENFISPSSPPSLSHPCSARVCDPTRPDRDVSKSFRALQTSLAGRKGTLRPQGGQGQISLLLAIVSESEIPGTHPAAARGQWKGHAMILVLKLPYKLAGEVILLLLLATLSCPLPRDSTSLYVATKRSGLGRFFQDKVNKETTKASFNPDGFPAAGLTALLHNYVCQRDGKKGRAAPARAASSSGTGFQHFKMTTSRWSSGEAKPYGGTTVHSVDTKENGWRGGHLTENRASRIPLAMEQVWPRTSPSCAPCSRAEILSNCSAHGRSLQLS